MNSGSRSLHLYLMGILRTISIVLFGVTYLLPSTGLYYVKHHCHHSGTRMIVWDDRYSCHDDARQISCCVTDDYCLFGSDDLQGFNSCCIKGEPQDPKNYELITGESTGHCCSNEIHYIKDYSQYDGPETAGKTKLQIKNFAAVAFWYTKHTSLIPALDNHNHSPPGLPTFDRIYISHKSLII